MNLNTTRRFALMSVLCAGVNGAAFYAAGTAFKIPWESLREPIIVLSLAGAVFGHLLLIARKMDLKRSAPDFRFMITVFMLYTAILLLVVTEYGIKFHLLPEDAFLYALVSLLSLPVIGLASQRTLRRKRINVGPEP